MNPILTTIITSALGTYVFPWLTTLLGSSLSTGQQGALTAGLVGGVTGLFHWLHTKFFPTMTTSGTTAKVLPFLVGVLLLGATTTGLTGCATLEKAVAPSSPYSPLIQAGVDVAVAEAVHKGVTAAQIKSIAQTALQADSGTTATVATVSAVVDQQIAKLNLSVGDKAAAQLLVSTLEGVLNTLLTNPGNSTAVANAQVAIAAVLNDVIAATSAYGV
jgi:hypothetical protein